MSIQVGAFSRQKALETSDFGQGDHDECSTLGVPVSDQCLINLMPGMIMIPTDRALWKNYCSGNILSIYPLQYIIVVLPPRTIIVLSASKIHNNCIGRRSNFTIYCTIIVAVGNAQKSSSYMPKCPSRAPPVVSDTHFHWSRTTFSHTTRRRIHSLRRFSQFARAFQENSARRGDFLVFFQDFSYIFEFHTFSADFSGPQLLYNILYNIQ